jgi:hypothetical protein
MLSAAKFNMQMHKGSWITKLHIRELPKNANKLADQKRMEIFLLGFLLPRILAPKPIWTPLLQPP